MMSKYIFNFLLVFSIIFFVSCGNFTPTSEWGKVSIHKIQVGDIEDAGGFLYFEYPASAVFSGEKSGTIEYDVCKISFGPGTGMTYEGDISPNKKSDNGNDYLAYFDNEGILFLYVAQATKYNYFFSAMDELKGVSACTDLIDFMAQSFTDKPLYENSKFSFSIPLPEDFRFEYENDGSGVMMKKSVVAEDSERNMEYEARYPKNYDVEISVKGYENDALYPDLGAYINDLYPGYTVDTVSVKDIQGVYVIEELNAKGIKHFFAMDGDAKIIYEAFLRVPKVYFSKHEKFFDEEIVQKLIFY